MSLACVSWPWIGSRRMETGPTYLPWPRLTWTTWLASLHEEPLLLQGKLPFAVLWWYTGRNIREERQVHHCLWPYINIFTGHLLLYLHMEVFGIWRMNKIDEWIKIVPRRVSNLEWNKTVFASWFFSVYGIVWIIGKYLSYWLCHIDRNEHIRDTRFTNFTTTLIFIYSA